MKRLGICLEKSDERKSIHAAAERRTAGTRVPRPLASLFRQEDTFVLLAREACPETLYGLPTIAIAECFKLRRVPGGVNTRKPRITILLAMNVLKTSAPN